MATLETMYPPQANSPATTLASPITDIATTITVIDASVLPAAPNLLTIGAETGDPETVLVTDITGDVLTVTRAQSGTTAAAWGAGVSLRRTFTSADHQAMLDNINELNGKQEPTDALTAEAELADGDAIPFYDTSETAHRKTLWSNIISKIRTALFGTANGLLKANGSGTISAATSGTDYAPSSHNQAASSITAGTLAGRVQANASAAATLSNAQVRDIYAGTADMTAGSTSLATGSLYFVYE